MNKLYNKILKEALDIMDFDSWDDTAQDFKDAIISNLETFIIYKKRTIDPGRMFIVFSGWLGTIVGGSRKNKYRFYNNYDEFTDSISINGKKENIKCELNGSISVDDNDRWFIPEKEYIFTFSDINNYPTHDHMFWGTELYKVPKPFHITGSVTEMFAYCKNLEYVTVFDASEVTHMNNLFGSDSNLQTVEVWKNLNDFVERYLYHQNELGEYHLTTVFQWCRKIDEKTIQDWNDVAIKAGVDPGREFFPHGKHGPTWA